MKPGTSVKWTRSFCKRIRQEAQMTAARPESVNFNYCVGVQRRGFSRESGLKTVKVVDPSFEGSDRTAGNFNYCSYSDPELTFQNAQQQIN